MLGEVGMQGALRQLPALHSLHCPVMLTWQHCWKGWVCSRPGVVGYQQVKKLGQQVCLMDGLTL